MGDGYRSALPLATEGTQECKGTPLRVLAVHSLAQRMNQETSTPSKASPYMGRMQLIPVETTSIKDLVWLSSLCPEGGMPPPGFAIVFDIPAFAAPCKGAQ